MQPEHTSGDLKAFATLVIISDQQSHQHKEQFPKKDSLLIILDETVYIFNQELISIKEFGKRPFTCKMADPDSGICYSDIDGDQGNQSS